MDHDYWDGFVVDLEIQIQLIENGLECLWRLYGSVIQESVEVPVAEDRTLAPSWFSEHRRELDSSIYQRIVKSNEFVNDVRLLPFELAFDDVKHVHLKERPGVSRPQSID